MKPARSTTVCQDPSRRGQRRAGGLTLVEVLISIAVISALVALLVPAVQAAREGARRAQCMNNFKQIGLALTNYHDLHRAFPPASIRPAGYVDNGRDEPRATWLILILPMMEHGPLYQKFNANVPTTDVANQVLRSTSVASYLCPSDGVAMVPFQPLLGAEFARGNYGANFGSGSWGEKYWQNDEYRGVMGQNTGLRISEILDGTTQTVCAAELRIQPSASDNRGVWAFDAPGASSLGLDCDLHCRRINGDSGSDWIPYCAPAPGQLNCHFQNNADSNAGPRSRHPNGANVLLSDGSVRFASENIAKPILRRLFTSADGGEVGEF